MEKYLLSGLVSPDREFLISGFLSPGFGIISISVFPKINAKFPRFWVSEFLFPLFRIFLISVFYPRIYVKFPGFEIFIVDFEKVTFGELQGGWL